MQENEADDIQLIIDELTKIEKEVLELSIAVKRNPKDLGFIVNA